MPKSQMNDRAFRPGGLRSPFVRRCLRLLLPAGVLFLCACAAPRAARPPGDKKQSVKAGAGEMRGARLFVIERGKNANIVRYDAVQDPDGALLPEAPVRAYWVLLAEDGRTKELGWLERKKAYGFDIAPGPEAGSYLLRLAASPERRFLLRRSGGRPAWRPLSTALRPCSKKYTWDPRKAPGTCGWIMWTSSAGGLAPGAPAKKGSSSGDACLRHCRQAE